MSFVCHSYVICIYAYVIRISSVCHSYLLVYHPYVTRMYLYVILMSPLYTCISFACHMYVLASLRTFTLINKRLTQLATNTVETVGTRVKKFNLARNDHGHTQRCEFSLLDRKHHLWANLAQKIKIVSLS